MESWFYKIVCSVGFAIMLCGGSEDPILFVGIKGLGVLMFFIGGSETICREVDRW